LPITFSVAAEVPKRADVLGVPVFAGRRLPKTSAAVDVAYLAERGFEGKVGETCPLPGRGRTVIAVGLGEANDVTADTLRRAAAALVRAAWRDAIVATTLLDAAPRGLDKARAAQAIVEGAALASYRFTTYKNDAKPCRVESMTVVGRGAGVKDGVARGGAIATAVALARDLVNEPAGAMTPRRLAEVATDIAQRNHLELEVLDEVEIANEGLGGLQGVARGSEEPPRLIRLVYSPPAPHTTARTAARTTARAKGATAKVPTIAFVGKGITFDSGGLSLKTADGMETMKTDMSGAAAVLAAMSVLPSLKPAVKVVAIVPTTENMPSGSAIKPGDVLKIRNGKTVEVLNTDAEGRLVLADGLSLAVEAKVDAIVDLATLTGACMVALGRSIAGLMGNDDELVDQVRAAAERAGESVWHLPLPKEYRKDIDSDVADIKNTGTGRYGGALTAGLFLEEFVDRTPWVHLDIAGPARAESDDGYVPKGGTGFGVRTIIETVLGFAPS
jgi:leucyl aminopeptidase